MSEPEVYESACRMQRIPTDATVTAFQVDLSAIGQGVGCVHVVEIDSLDVPMMFCNCGAYVTNYGCIHVRALAHMSKAAPSMLEARGGGVMPDDPRLCLFCTNFKFDTEALEGYWDQPAVIKCEKGHWSLNGGDRVVAAGLRRCLAGAVTCRDYEHWKEA